MGLNGKVEWDKTVRQACEWLCRQGMKNLGLGAYMVIKQTVLCNSIYPNPAYRFSSCSSL